MSDAHAFCAPSGWEKWSVCAGSAALEEQEPESESEYAAEGTLMHELSAKVLRKQPAEIPPSLREPIDAYCKAVLERVESYRLAGAREVQLFVEQKVDISEITGEKNAVGTSDCIIIAEFLDGRCVLEIRDAKFGTGVEVEVVENGQLIIYALAAAKKYELLYQFTEVVLAIHQPRIRERAIEWPLKYTELLSWRPVVWDKAQLALSLRGDTAALDNLNPGDHCRRAFCKVQARCPALAAMVEEQVRLDFDDESKLTADAPEDQARLSVAMQRVPLIESWCKAVRAKVEQKLLAGAPVQGFKLVMGRRGARAWKDADAVEKLLIADGQSPDKIFSPRLLISPTQIENVLKGAPILETLAESWVTQSEGKPSVAPEDDPREPYRPHAEDDFDSYDGSDLV